MDKFSKILVSAAAASVLASGAMASGLVFGKYIKDGTRLGDHNVSVFDPTADTEKTIKDASADAFGAIKVDELLKSQSNLDINSTDATSWHTSGNYNRMLAYYSDADLAKFSTLRFKINCGMIEKTGDLKLYAWDYNDSKFVPVTTNLVDFKTATKGSITGYTEIRFKLDATDYNDHNFSTYDGGYGTVSNGAIPAGAVLVFGQDTNGSGGITKLMVVPKKGDKCGCVCDTTIEMTEAKDDNGQDLSAPMVTGTTPLITYTTGLSAKVYHRIGESKLEARFADSYIDTTAGVDRKKFVDENLTKADTGLLISRFHIGIEEKAEYGIALGANDNFAINVNRAIYCAVKDVKIYETNSTGDVVENAKLNKDSDGAYKYESNFGKYKFDVNKSSSTVSSVSTYVDISVNGTDVICPGMWRVSLTVTPDEQGVGETKILDVANAADWRINAMQFIIPYLNTDPNYGTYIVITNMGDKAASVFFDAYGDSGKNEGQATSAYYTNVQLGDIPKRSTRIYFPKDMNAAIKAKFPAWNANRYMAKFYVVADENNIEAAAFQKDGNNGKRSIPVLTTAYHNEGNFTDPDWKGHKFHE